MSSIYPATFSGPLDLGETGLVQKETVTTSGSKTVDFSIQSDDVLVSLYASVVSGTLDVEVYTVGEEGEEKLLFSFPQLTAPTTELLLKKSAATLSHIRVKTTWSATCTFSIRAKAISAGESSVKIVGAGDWSVEQTTVTTAAAILIASDLTDRSGLVIKNYAGGGVLFVAESLAKATTAIAYPLALGESLAMDLAAGQEIYAVSSSGSIDVRIAQGGA